MMAAIPFGRAVTGYCGIGPAPGFRALNRGV